MDPVCLNFETGCCEAPLTLAGTCSACGEQVYVGRGDAAPAGEPEVCREIIRSRSEVES